MQSDMWFGDHRQLCTKIKIRKVVTFPSLFIIEMAMLVKTNKNLFPTMTETRKRPVGKLSNNVLQICIISCYTALMRKSVVCIGPTMYYKYRYNKLPDVVKNYTINIKK